jgi:hypothetical protein
MSYTNELHDHNEEFFDANDKEIEEDEAAVAMDNSADNIKIRDYLQSVAATNQQMRELVGNLFLDSESSDDDSIGWGGSVPGKAPNKNRDFLGAYQRLVQNYFSGTNSKFDEKDFERRFRMPREVFNRIAQHIIGKPPFDLRQNPVTKKNGIFPLVRLTACLRRLAYGDAADREDENLEISDSTLTDSLKAFTKLVKHEFGQFYMNRCPNEQETMRAVSINSARGFPGMFASWDCKHFAWKNCPVALAGQHKGKGTEETLILEAIADADLYIWYHFFGEAGSLNDINILNKSSIVGSILDGSFATKILPYTILNKQRDWLYFLVDGIYPPYSIFISTILHPQNEEEKYFATCQEACRKDIERAFGTLVQRFHILQRPLRNWYWNDIVDILDCCIILHNMVVENRRTLHAVEGYVNSGEQQWHAAVDAFANAEPPENVSLFVQEDVLANLEMADIIAIRVAHFNNAMKNADEHHSLKNDLITHLWNRHHNAQNNNTLE